MFLPPGHSLNIGTNMLPSGPFMSWLDSLLGYSSEEFQALQLIVFVVFGAVDISTCLLYVGPPFENLV